MTGALQESNIEIIYNGNIFESDCDIIVNPVNKVGVMGGGLAKAFKDRYPEMNVIYEANCDSEDPIWPHYYQEEDYLICNFPTKDHWKNPSTYELVEENLIEMSGVENLQTIDNGDGYLLNFDITDYSIAFSALGCGLGGLDFDKVKDLIHKYFKDHPKKVVIYAPHGEPEPNIGNLEDSEILKDYGDYITKELDECFREKTYSFFTNVVSNTEGIDQNQCDRLFKEADKMNLSHVRISDRIQLYRLKQIEGLKLKQSIPFTMFKLREDEFLLSWAEAGIHTSCSDKESPGEAIAEYIVEFWKGVNEFDKLGPALQKGINVMRNYIDVSI